MGDGNQSSRETTFIQRTLENLILVVFRQSSILGFFPIRMGLGVGG